jgi:4-hydroxybenzoate polyprenyltransferase
MVSARSAAISFNRLANQWIDARNPRTASRELPRGVLSRSEVWAFFWVSVAVFLLAAAQLNGLCLALARSPSPSSRLLVHEAVHGGVAAGAEASLAVAPVGAWLAIRGRFEAVPLALALAVMLWVAGFDTIYACQDLEFDRSEGLRSIPASLGVRRALFVARALHVLAVAVLLGLYALAPLHALYIAGVAAVAGVLAYEHTLVRPDDLSRVMQAFNLNGWVSLGYFAFTAAAAWLAGPR